MKTLEQLTFNNTYHQLPDIFYSRHQPRALAGAFLIHTNSQVARMIGLADEEFQRNDFLEMVSGQKSWPGTSPLAMCYAGHQFGQLVPRLGDGRAILLAQIVSDNQQPWDLQLKGAGKTLYSRAGDGRAVLRSSIREYLCSAAMHGLGIATSHALFLSGSSEEVYRERIETGAMIMRVARSHIRFGHFEYFFYQQRYDDLERLLNYVINQYYPHLKLVENPCLDFFLQVVSDTAKMIADWQAVGFAHGVMNTDNMSIHGLTLDYGPFAFLDNYQAGFVCNHSDYQGRYAFDKQVEIGLFNLSCLAQALLPLFDDDTSNAVEIAKAAINQYQPQFVEYYSGLMRAKIGLLDSLEGDRNLINDLLKLLEKYQLDYTLFFRQLSEPQTEANLQSLANWCRAGDDFEIWLQRYNKRLEQENTSIEQRSQQMKKVNPRYILRNYLAEMAIRKAEDENDFSMIDDLMTVLQQPYEEHPEHKQYASEPPDWAAEIEISCSS